LILDGRPRFLVSGIKLPKLCCAGAVGLFLGDHG
jgi:hypothetical protein